MRAVGANLKNDWREERITRSELPTHHATHHTPSPTYPPTGWHSWLVDQWKQPGISLRKKEARLPLVLWSLALHIHNNSLYSFLYYFCLYFSNHFNINTFFVERSILCLPIAHLFMCIFTSFLFFPIYLSFKVLLNTSLLSFIWPHRIWFAYNKLRSITRTAEAQLKSKDIRWVNWSSFFTSFNSILPSITNQAQIEDILWWFTTNYCYNCATTSTQYIRTHSKLNRHTNIRPIEKL